MKKDKKFLGELEKCLEGVSLKNKEIILEKYRNIIAEEREKNKKISVILKELGKPSEIAEKEKELLGKESFFDKIKNKIYEFKSSRSNNELKEEKKKLKEEQKQAKKELKEEKKQSKKELKEEKKKLIEEIEEEKQKAKKELNNEKEKFNEEKDEIKKEIKKEKEEINEEKKELRENKFKAFFASLTKDISFKKKDKKKEEFVENVKDTNIIEEALEEVKEEVSEVSEIVSENRLFEIKSDRRKRIILKTLGVILTVLLLFIWLWVTVVFLASLFAYLDGVKFIGINVGLLGLDLLILWVIILVNKAIFKKKSKFLINIIVSVVLLFIVALGIVLSVKQISEIKTVKDVSVKYSMTNKVNTYYLPSEEDKKFVINFNSNYKTQYLLEYDNTLKDKVKVEVKYYECYYDYFIKETSNNIYISLKLDNRDRLSVYIDDLKEGLVFDNDELSRYVVKIKVHPNNASRLVILN